MCVVSDFDDTIKICEFFSGDDLPVKAVYENYYFQSVLHDWRVVV